jgi:branched-chain amino acid transport system permease protein
MDAHTLGILGNIGMFAFLALSAYVLLLVGEISFGQQAYFGLGAYAAGIGTAMLGLDLASGLLLGLVVGAAAAAAVGALTLRLRGLYFAVATLAFAEIVRLGFEILRFQRTVKGEPVGPNGPDGFRDIRWIYDNGIDQGAYVAIVYALLALALLVFVLAERGRLGSILRTIGADPLLAATQGLAVTRWKIGAAAAAGALAGLGGGLYAHSATYIEPALFNVMLGIHSLAYGLIGGLGTAFGPLLGVVLDLGVLQPIQAIASYRMIVFGGLVAVLLIFLPRGILHEGAVRAIGRAWRRRRASGRQRDAAA